MVKQTGVEDYAVTIPKKALIVMHFDKQVQSVLEQQGHADAFNKVTEKINRLKKQFSRRNMVVTIHHKNHESDEIPDPLVVSNKRSNLKRIASIEPRSLLKLPDEHVFVNHRNTKGMDETAVLRPYLDLELLVKEHLVPMLREKGIKSTVIVGAEFGACVGKCAEILAENGIEAVIHGEATIKAVEVEDKERNKAKKSFGSKITDYVDLSPAMMKLFRKAKFTRFDYVQGPKEKIRYKPTTKK